MCIRDSTKGGRMIVMVLMVVSIITVGSTIRLSVFARRREIEIMKYVCLLYTSRCV